MKIPSTNRIAILISLIATLVTFWVSENVYERIPHIEDEFAYTWQAQVFAQGQAAISSPAQPELLMVPFVVDYHGLRFGKYPPGWPLILAFGALTGMTPWVNPILAGLGIWLTFRLGQKIFDSRTGLLAACLMLTSPFFLLNSSTLLSHPWSLFLSLTFTLAWMDLFFNGAEKESAPSSDQKITQPIPAWIKIGVAGLGLGVLALTRPLTAVGLGLPFFLQGLTLLRRGNSRIRYQVLIIGLLAGSTAAILSLWQFLLTGDPMQNLYTLWWGYDRLGFGDGAGTQPGGHNLFWVMNNLVLSLIAGSSDLFGWAGASWLFIPFGLWAARQKKPVELILGVPAGLAVAYTIYWTSPNVYGPRYYYESIFSLCLLTAAGILWVMGRFNSMRRPGIFRTAGVPLFICLLVGYDLLVYLPYRLNSMRNVYGISRDQQAPFLTREAEALTPALVIVHTQEWTDCAGLLPLQDPWLTTPFIFGCDINNSMELVDLNEYSDRTILHYYPEKTGLFLSAQQ